MERLSFQEALSLYRLLFSFCHQRKPAGKSRIMRVIYGVIGFVWGLLSILVTFWDVVFRLLPSLHLLIKTYLCSCTFMQVLRPSSPPVWLYRTTTALQLRHSCPEPESSCTRELICKLLVRPQDSYVHQEPE